MMDTRHVENHMLGCLSKERVDRGKAEAIRQGLQAAGGRTRRQSGCSKAQAAICVSGAC